MTFLVGDVIPLYATITFSGVEFDLSTNSGTSSGTVVAREISGLTPELVTDYLYRVQLFEPLVVGSGTASQSQSEFWLSEDEINGVVDDSLIFNVDELNSTLSSGIGTVSNNKSIIDQTLSQIDTASPYNTDVARLSSLAGEVLDFLTSSDTSEVNNSPTEENQTATVISGVATNGSFNTEIFKEISDNLYGFYTIVNETEAELKVRAEQEAEQEALAIADDQANFKVFFDSYVNNQNYTGLLSPKTVTESGTTNLSDFIDTSELSENSLIGDSLLLETDE